MARKLKHVEFVYDDGTVLTYDEHQSLLIGESFEKILASNKLLEARISTRFSPIQYIFGRFAGLFKI